MHTLRSSGYTLYGIYIYDLTFIQTHRKSHTKELWGLLGPQDLVLYPCTDRKSIRAISVEKNDDFIPLGSQKTLRVPFKVKSCQSIVLITSIKHFEEKYTFINFDVS